MTRTTVLLSLLLPALALAAAPATQPTSQPTALAPGDYRRTIEVDGRTRSYLVHVPPGYEAEKATPIVLVFHGALINGPLMARFCGLNQKADAVGFVAVYPNGWGVMDTVLFFNAWTPPSPVGVPPDDVKFTALLLDDLATAVHVDPKRVFATGISNGAMMCHRLAAELSGRIAAIAPVSGTLTIKDPAPKRPVPVLCFHGTADTTVPYDGPKAGTLKFGKIELDFKADFYMSVEDTVKTWVKLDGCPPEPKVTTMPDTAKDGTTVTKRVYGPGKEESEVVLFVIEGGGHTWPGQPSLFPNHLGKATMNISANDLIWEFFQKHPMK